jgi:outer membrane protein assembly factor BamB
MTRFMTAIQGRLLEALSLLEPLLRGTDPRSGPRLCEALQFMVPKRALSWRSWLSSHSRFKAGLPASSFAVCTSIFVVLLGPASFPTHADDWPQWRGPNRDGVWRETEALETFPVGGLDITWRAPVGRGWSSPVVADGRVFVTDVKVARPNAIERVLCFDEANGKQLWIHDYKAPYPDWAFTPDAGGPRATPLVRDGKLYARGATGRLFCFDAARGDVIWEKDLGTDYRLEAFSGITSSPLIDENLLILLLFAKQSAAVVALDRNSGKEVWRALDDTFSYSSPIVITAGGKGQLIVWSQEGVTALDPATGKTWWREVARIPGDLTSASPVFDDHRLLVAGMMFQLDPDRPSASLLWPESRAASQRVFSNTSTPLLLGDCVYSARTSGELVCLDAATGRELWQTNTVTDLKNGSSIHLTPNGDSVLLFTDEGNLLRARLSANGYVELGRTHLIDPTHPFNGRNVVWPPPAYANGHVFVRNDRELICASLESRSEK